MRRFVGVPLAFRGSEGCWPSKTHPFKHKNARMNVPDKKKTFRNKNYFATCKNYNTFFVVGLCCVCVCVYGEW